MSIVWCQVSDIVLRALAPRVLRQQRRKRREGTNTRQPQAYLAIWTKQLTLGIYTLCLKVELQNMSTARILLYKNLHLTRRPSTVYTVCMCTWSVWCRDKESGFEDRASRRKARRHSSSSESSEVNCYQLLSLSDSLTCRPSLPSSLTNHHSSLLPAPGLLLTDSSPTALPSLPSVPPDPSPLTWTTGLLASSTLLL